MSTVVEGPHRLATAAGGAPIPPLSLCFDYQPWINSKQRKQANSVQNLILLHLRENLNYVTQTRNNSPHSYLGLKDIQVDSKEKLNSE